MTHSATTSPTDQRLDWWGRPITEVCTVPWCAGDCVLTGPGPLDHSRVLAAVGTGDSAVLLLMSATGDDAPTVRLYVGDSDAVDLAPAAVDALLAGLSAGSVGAR